MNRSFAQSRRLLAIARLRSESEPDGWRVLPVAVAVLNLLVCGYHERMLQEDGYSLSLYLFLQAAAAGVLQVLHFHGSLSMILLKTRQFPTSSRGRFLFVAASHASRPLTAALIGSNLLFLAVHYRHNPAAASTSCVLFLLMMALVALLVSFVALVLLRRSPNLPGLAALTGAVLLGLLLASLVFRIDPIVTDLPFLRWTADGIRAALAGDRATAALKAAYLLATSAALLAAGTRWT
jgi:hypothetical protein